MNTTSDFLGHPKGLFVCFTTEMWERFSYYGMRALLIFYLTDHWDFTRDNAYVLYGAYTSLVYMMPVIGGMLADRFLGSRKSVTYGAILLVLGHGLMAYEESEQLFYLALALIISGVGFLKPNISTMVGALYPEGDKRRDSGFTIFYMGINIGAATASLLCGYLGKEFGWAYGFGAAGIGMVFGLIVFLWGQKQETTATWYGLFTNKGQKTEVLDYVSKSWTGKWPTNKAPSLDSIFIEGQTKHQNVKLLADNRYEAVVYASDDNDKMKYTYQIYPESMNTKSGGDLEKAPPAMTGLIKKKKDNVVEFRAPFEEGPYRLFVYVEDDVEKIAYANVPFFVLPRDKNMKQSRPLQLKKRNLKIVD